MRVQNQQLNTKEIIVLLIGIGLVTFLYLMRHPSPNTKTSFSVTQDNTPLIGIEKTVENKTFFDPTTQRTVIEDILDIPAWKFKINDLEKLTSEELVTTIQKSIEQEHYFEPENQNTLFYLVNLKQIDSQNENIARISEVLTQQLTIQTNHAIEQGDDKLLTKAIAQLKTLDNNNPKIKELKQKLSTIKTINKLYVKGTKQLQDNLVITADSQDAWHSAKQAIEIDPTNSKANILVAQVNGILINSALRAAEEIDFQLAQQQINQAKLLAPESINVQNAQLTIESLKQQRYVWLEQQINQAITTTNIKRAEKMLSQLIDLDLPNTVINDYRNEIARMKLYGSYIPLETFNDMSAEGTKLPDMVIMPIGEFEMGYNQGPKHEKPVHSVTINYGFAVSQKEISVADFALFIEATGYKTDAEKKHSSIIYDTRTGRLKNKNRITWKKDYQGKKAKPQSPVIHVSWNDANYYVQWLKTQTNKEYRLPSEAEFEYFLRAGSRAKYPWGNGTPLQVTENLTGKLDRLKGNSRIRWKKGFEDYNDNYWGPAPVGSFIPNQFNLYDTAGNIMEWTTDCWHDSYTRAPTDGSAWINQGCENHVIRGGSWSSSKNEFRSSHRFIANANFTDARLGFRIALDLK
jgi:formylglycine-generating enzyme required for sulfatase activity